MSKTDENGLPNTWRGTRQVWNEKGQCAREACRQPLGMDKYYNTSTRLFYCADCGTLINKYNPGLCVR